MGSTKECILAVDPGNMKSGIATIDVDFALLHKEIVPTNMLEETLNTLITDLLEEGSSIRAMVCGDGTNHKHVFSFIEEIGNKHHVPTFLVNESYSTEEARKRYWNYHPPRGIKRFIPTSFQVPPCPVDDFTAWIIGERFLTKQ